MNSSETLHIFGYKNKLDFFIDIISKNNLPNKILMSGSKGIGKSLFAYHLINFILSKDEDLSYDLDRYMINKNNRSFNLINSFSHPNFMHIEKNNEKRNIEISQIREIKNFINKSSFNDNPKIILINDAEYLSKSSSNAVLKILEEENNKVQFILIYDNTKKILDTVKSRCIEFKFELHERFIPDIVNNYFNANIFEEINKSFKNIYFKPIDFINLVKLSRELEVDLKKINILELTKLIVDKNIYKTKKIDMYFIKLLIEGFFIYTYRTIKNKDFYIKAKLFNKKFDQIIKFNLDIESFFFELDLKLIHYE